MHHTAATSAGGATVAAGSGNPTNSTVRNLSQMAKVLPQIIDGIVIFLSFHGGFLIFLQGLVLAFFLHFLCFSESSLPFYFNLLLYVLSLNIYSKEKKNVQRCSTIPVLLFASMYLIDFFQYQTMI